MSSNFIIVGAGPSGLYLARELGKVLDGILIFEEDKELGLPPHCTGLVNLNSVRALGIEPPIVNVFRYVRITDLDGNDVIFDFRTNSIAMLDRPGLEHYLAEGINASVLLNERVFSINPKGVTTRHYENVDYEAAVIAEGAIGTLSSRLIPWRQEHVYGIQSDVKSFSNTRLIPRNVDEIVVVFDRRLSEHFFAWIVPRDSHEYRVGVADDANVWTKFTELLKFMETESNKIFGGKIIIGGSPGHVVSGNVAVIGDAAGFVKPMTGGGIIMGMVSAKILADSIRYSLKEGLSVKDGLVAYDNVFRRLVRGRITALSAASRILHGLIGSELNDAIKALSNTRVQVLDYDNHVGAVVKVALVRPTAFLRALSFLMNGITNQDIKTIMGIIRYVLGE